MAWSGSNASGSGNTARALALGALGVAAIVAVAMVFSGSATAARVADNAEDLHWANAMLGSGQIARLATGQAVLVAGSTDSIADDGGSLDVAIAEARVAVRSAQSWAARPEGDPEVAVVAEDLVEAAEDVLLALEREDLEVARATLAGRLTTAADSLRDILADAQARAASDIRRTEAAAGQVATILQFVVVLILPLLALMIYRRRARTEMEKAAIRHRAELDAARALNDARVDLIAGVSHQFRTPLTAISGFGEVLADDQALEPHNRDMVRMLVGEARNLERMVSDLLVAARMGTDTEHVDRTEVEIVSLTTRICGDFDPAPVITADYPEVWLETDGEKVGHVVRNLIANAAKHGGPDVNVRIRAEGPDLTIDVVDNGPGVGPELETRLFEPFTNEGGRAILTGSIGMGLAVARALAVAIGGSLSYERTDLTVFSLHLPAALQRVEEPAGVVTGA